MKAMNAGVGVEGWQVGPQGTDLAAQHLGHLSPAQCGGNEAPG